MNSAESPKSPQSPPSIEALIRELTARLRARDDGGGARLESELLVAHVLGVARVALLSRGNDLVDPDRRTAIRGLLERRLRAEPVAYLTGVREFHGRSFRVGPGVLVPRPETEHLVDAVLARGVRGLVADVGTGSGAIAITLALEARGAMRVLALERESAALTLARRNVTELDARDRVELVRSDLLQAIRPGAALAAVVANLPYVAAREFDRLDATVQRFEPRAALVPEGSTPAQLRARLLEQARERVQPMGLVALEVGAGQAGEARDQSLRAGYRQVEIVNDLAGIGRVVLLRRMPG